MMPKLQHTTASYAKDVFQDSLITGIPQVVQTHSLSRRLLKSAVLGLCLFGFIYQTTVFMKIFWRYPTVLDIDVEYPETIESPAITFCNLNGIKINSYCKKFPGHCAKPNDRVQFCLTFPEACDITYLEDKEPQYPVKEHLHFENEASADDLRELGHSGNVTLRFCKRIAGDGTDHQPCGNDTMIRMPMADGNTGLRNCFALFSSVNSKKIKEHILPVPKKKDLLLHMVFEMEAEEYFRPDRQVGSIVSIHSPNIIKNPFFDGFVVKPGHMYSVHLKVVEEKLLPFPYETKCKDYNKLWEQRGGKGPLSQEMCIGECVYNASMRLCNCVIPNVLYYHEERMCSNDELDCFDFNISECYNYCQQPCDFTDFEYDVQERKLEDNTIHEIEDLYHRRLDAAVVMVFLKRPEIIIYNHRPQYEDIEVFSFMGGYVGMWLGVSLIAVFDFLESVVKILWFWLQRRLKAQ